jgi:hypothetical protein
LLDAAAARFLGSAPAPGAAGVASPADTAAWFADAPGDGPEAAARALAASRAFGRRPRGLVAIRCGRPAELRRHVPNVESATFPPLFTLPLAPESLPDLADLPVPPILPVLEHCERARYPEVVVSTPGPLGLAGLLAGKLLGVRITGVYPHGLLRRIAAGASSDAVVAAARLYLRWFYGQMDRVAAADPAGRERLLELGLDPARVAVVPAVTPAVLETPDVLDPVLELESVA